MSIPPPPPSGPGRSWVPPSPPHVWGPPPGRGPGRPALNGFALASLLVGLLCFPPLGIVFGVVALVQIANRRERGKALAVTGLAVSVAMTAVFALAAGPLVRAVGDRLDAVSVPSGAEGELTDMEDLSAGECFNVPGGDLTGRQALMYAVDCAEPHHAEVTSSGPFDLPGSERAGSHQADSLAQKECWKAQDAYAMDTWALPPYAEMYYFPPSSRSWNEGDRQLLCVIGTTTREHSGSVRKDRGMLTSEQAEYLTAANALDLAFGRAPEEDAADALQEHQAWAREVYSALGDEVAVLRRHATRPGIGEAARARLKEAEAARAGWQRASQARTAAEFDRLWERADGAMSVTGEKALRGAYGLSTTVPDWLEEDAAGPGGGGPGGPGGSGDRPSTESA
ncbi:DUF4190 domain-containing protein [Streptomyces sp. NPDC058622]|uniref:DUF4190 domain-containing protein n=1 Tax=Streptomyces sp. NPDC058622 TaxID=3346562 RepID=UPI003650C704